MYMAKSKSRVKVAAGDWRPPKAGVPKGHGIRTYSVDAWRKHSGSKEKWQGIYVFKPVDPYKPAERKEFRSAMDNPYVYRATRIQSSFVAGQGFTTEIVPRKEEDVQEDQLENWKMTAKIKVPYWDDKEFTPDQIKDFIDKMSTDMGLESNIFNAYFTALEQGRCVLALTPLERDENGLWQMPEQIRYIRPEFTLRPLVNDNTNELAGVNVIGVISKQFLDSLPIERMIYIMHGFNNEIFSDYYGDSKVARVSDIANTLNILLNEDYQKIAKSRWHTPRVFGVPIPPQEADKEESILSDFIGKVNEGEGLDVAVTGPSNPEEIGVTVISQGGSPADIGGIEMIRQGEIKAIITAYGMPAFMLSEGDVGSLGGNANIEEIDSYLNTEVRSEVLMLEDTIEKQFYDRILSVLFRVEDADEIPIKLVHKFNKPKLATLMTPAMFSVLTGLLELGLIDPNGLRDILGLAEADKQTISKGADRTPGGNINKVVWKTPVQVNVNTGNGWGQPNVQTSNPWGSTPKQDEGTSKWKKSQIRGLFNQ